LSSCGQPQPLIRRRLRFVAGRPGHRGVPLTGKWHLHVWRTIL